DRYTSDAIFLGTDKTERWTIEEFKAYAKPAFADGNGWTYSVVERNWEGVGDTRWFDEILFNEKLGHCRGTGVVQLIEGEWKILHYALTMLVPNEIAAEVGAQTQEAENK
ncbi:MAG: nuclear transport factor 2 family protein, partial [Proteobacteria bacterium]|nr:nuclear transport factor 2 family protein [Pseudomonadota bacterium]